MAHIILPRLYSEACAWSTACSFDTDCTNGPAALVCKASQCQLVGASASASATAFTVSVSFVVSGLALSAGVGGGGLYVPLLIGAMSMDPKAATAVSQAMLAGGALAAIGSNVREAHPLDKRRPLIDFDLALLMGPCLMAGAQVGSVLNAASPSWFILILLLVVLADSTFKTCKKGWQLHRKERKEQARQLEPMPPAVMGSADAPPAEEVEMEALVEEEGADSSFGNQEPLISDEPYWTQRLPWMKLIGLVGVWMLQSVIYSLKGGKGANSAVGIRHCSSSYWFVTIVSVVAQLSLGAAVASKVKIATNLEKEGADVEALSAWKLFTWSVLAGIVASMCGIGGGMVMGPKLLESGIHPQVSAATTASTLLMLSTTTAMAFLAQGTAPLEQALGFGAVTFCGSAVLQTLVTLWVKRSGRPSLIVFILAGILIVSACLLGLLGLRNVWTSLTTGKGLSFTNPCVADVGLGHC